MYKESKPFIISVGSTLLLLSLLLTIVTGLISVISHHIRIFYNPDILQHQPGYIIATMTLTLLFCVPTLFFIYKGSNTARHIYLGLFIISFISWVFNQDYLITNQTVISELQCINLLLDFIGLILLYTRKSSAWFKKM